MLLSDIHLGQVKDFVAMEYHALILNRTFWVFVVEDTLVGIHANGAISAQSEDFSAVGFATNLVLDSRIVRGDLNDPYSYPKASYIIRNKSVDLLSDEFLRIGSNFRINKRDIKNVYHDPSKKWGMAQYPHDGKVYIETNDGKKREFIILGNQSGTSIAQMLSAL